MIERVRVGLRIKPELNKRLQEIAEREDISKNKLIEQVLKKYVEKSKGE